MKKTILHVLVRFKRLPILTSILLYCCLTLQLSAQQDLTQHKVTLVLKNATLKEAFSALQNQSGVHFIFDHDIQKYEAIPITCSEKDMSVEKITEILLRNTRLQFVAMKDRIVISEKTTKKNDIEITTDQAENGIIRGRIVDFESSEPLPGASVTIPALKRGMVSDKAGNYLFTDLPEGRITLQVSYIGYNTERVQLDIKKGRGQVYDVRLQGASRLNEVVVTGGISRRAPVAHTSDKQVLELLKNARSVVSGISSQQIAISADRNVAEVVKKIAGVTINDDKFIIIRGMNERYNLTYLNNNVAPSTELYSRAFSLDLLPSRIIDKILVYKSPAPDLMGDMTGGAVKIFTKDAREVKHFDVELQLGNRPNTTFNNQFLTYQGGKTDFLGFDDGTRKLPSVVPGYGNFTQANITQQDYASQFKPYLQYGKKMALPMIQITANYYNSFKIGGKRLGMLSSLSYKREQQQYDVDRSSSFWGGNDQRTHTVVKETQSNETVQVNLLQNFTYKLKDSSTLFLKNYFLQQGQSATVIRNNKNDQYIVGDSTTDLSTLSKLQWRDRNPGYDVYERNIILSYTQRFLYSGNIGGEHYFSKGKHQLDWNLGYTFSHQVIPDQRVIRFNQNRQDGGTSWLSGKSELGWMAAYRYIPSIDNYSKRDNSLQRGMISRTWSQNNERVYNGSADYTIKIKPWITFKAGTYQQWKSRVLFRRVYTLNEGDLNSAGFPDDRMAPIGSNGKYMDFNKVLYTEQDLGKVWSRDYLKDDGSALKVFDRTSGSDAYIATEQLNAGYVAVSLLPFNEKLDIYGGLRVEYNRQQVAGAIPGYKEGDINQPVLVDNKSTDFLPSLNISYKPVEQLVIRAAYGKTVNRPEFRELSPYSELDYLNNQTIQGNNFLKPATASNYDVRIEWYPKDNKNAETFSIGGFYKNLISPIERTIYRDLYFGGPAIISFANADKAVVKGLEFEVRKNLGFIPANFFNNLSLIGNLTLIKSEVEKRLDTSVLKNPDPGINPHYTRQLQGQAPYIANLGLYYDNAGSGTKVAVTWNLIGPRIYAAANGKPFNLSYDGNVPVVVQGDQGSIIELQRHTLDFALTQRIIKSLQLKFSAQNILNQPIRMAEDENYTYKYEKAHRTQSNTTVNSADTNGDIISTEYKTDRHFILSFMYSF
ncbi:TonB-dependent receptor [Chitinophaga pendula]|uniref:TonB-dependent receptor n=1 Tax=Chitinophaga TaxID=79328 RepID=UPI0018DF1C5A|nr:MULTISPECIES: TonB-dependent receptor [Chitinophaga]UCJ09936.1 TonB-dependent receptor [Chitinophaga pendula]